MNGGLLMNLQDYKTKHELNNAKLMMMTNIQPTTFYNHLRGCKASDYTLKQLLKLGIDKDCAGRCLKQQYLDNLYYAYFGGEFIQSGLRSEILKSTGLNSATLSFLSSPSGRKDQDKKEANGGTLTGWVIHKLDADISEFDELYIA